MGKIRLCTGTMPYDLPLGDTWPQRVRRECKTGDTRRARKNHESVTRDQLCGKRSSRERSGLRGNASCRPELAAAETETVKAKGTAGEQKYERRKDSLSGLACGTAGP